MAILGVRIDAMSVYYRVVIITTRGEKEFRVRDDGWQLRVMTMDNKPVGGFSFGTDSERKPDRDSALEGLKEWAPKHFDSAYGV